MNEIAQLLARPMPLGLMLVFFFVALALGSLFIARAEAKHKKIQAQYRAEIDRLRGYGADLAGPYHYSSLEHGRSGGWFGWLIALGLGAAVGVAVLVTLRDGPSPGLSAITSLDAPRVERVEPPAVKLGAVLAEPVRPVEPVKAPALEKLELPAVAQLEKKPAAVPQAPAAAARRPEAAQAEGGGEDEEIERMLRLERRRAAERRLIRRRAKAQRSGQRVQAAPRNPAPARVERQAAAPRQQPAPSKPAPSDSLDSAEKAADALLQEVPKPRKRRKKLRLDQSGDPLASAP